MGSSLQKSGIMGTVGAIAVGVGVGAVVLHLMGGAIKLAVGAAVFCFVVYMLLRLIGVIKKK